MNSGREKKIQKLWVAEALRRRNEVRSGHVKTIPYKKALSLVHAVTHNGKLLQSSFANANQLEALLLKASAMRPMTAKRKARIYGDLKRS